MVGSLDLQALISQIERAKCVCQRQLGPMNRTRGTDECISRAADSSLPSIRRRRDQCACSTARNNTVAEDRGLWWLTVPEQETAAVKTVGLW